jgi:hypothetical protein
MGIKALHNAVVPSNVLSQRLLVVTILLVSSTWGFLYALNRSVSMWRILEIVLFVAGLAALYEAVERRWSVFRRCPVVPRGLLRKWLLLSLILLCGELVFTLVYSWSRHGGA